MNLLIKKKTLLEVVSSNMNQDNFDATKIEYRSALYLLKLLYEKALKITDVAIQGLIRFDSPLLNQYYAPTLFLIEKIIRRDDFETLKDGTRYLFPTLMGYEELDTEWKKERASAYAFFAKIESKWLEVGRPTFVLPEDLQKVFDDMDKAMIEYEKQRKETEKKFTSKPDKENLIDKKGGFIHLDNDGNFWIEPKDKFCYSMGVKSARYKILSYLVDNKGYQDPNLIANFIGKKDSQSIRIEIGKIKRKIENHLKIDDIIQSKKDSGYKINPVYKIIKN